MAGGRAGRLASVGHQRTTMRHVPVPPGPYGDWKLDGNPAPIAAGSLASRAIIGPRSPSHSHAQLGQKVT